MNADDLKLLQASLAAGLPLSARWVIDETPWDWDFSLAQQELQPASEADISGGDLPPEWLELYLFGSQDYSEGGGARPFVGIHKDTGAVYGLDVERDSECLYFLNSSVPCFIETYWIFFEILGEGTGSRHGLPARVRAADPEGFDQSEWKDLANELGL